MLFFGKKPEFVGRDIDLIPMRVSPPDRELGFGTEQVWRIVLHGEKKEIGQISFRDGESLGVYYFGHIGYHIDRPYRGNHYAFHACEMIQPAIRMSGKSSLVITCDPENAPSRKTCEKLGCELERIVDVPADFRERFEISAVKCRYIWRPLAERRSLE